MVRGLVDWKRRTGVYGRSIPVVYGTAKVRGSIILSGAYIEKYSSGMSEVARSVELIMFGICEGPISSVLKMWRGTESGTLAKFNMTLLTGTRSQAPWSVLSTSFPSFALGYGGTAIAATNVQWPTDLDGGLQAVDFEVKGLSATKQDGTTSAYDAHPADVLADLLTNAEYGAGWSPTRLDGYVSALSDAWSLGASGTAADSWRRYCDACGFYVSMVISQTKPLSDYVSELMTATNSMAIWSNGRLKVVPLGDQAVTGNGVTYTPNITPVYDLGASGPGNDFLADPGTDPVQAEMTRQADAWNLIPVEYVDRNPADITDPETGTVTKRDAYITNVAEAADPVDVELYGRKKGESVRLDCITRADHAQMISRLLAQQTVYSRSTFRFRLGWRYVLLEPGDLVSLTEAKLGIDHKLCRILEIEEDSGGAFSVVAQEWTVGQGTAAVYSTSTSAESIPRSEQAPPAVLDSLVVAPALAASDDVPALWVGVAGAGVDFGGAQVWLSWDAGVTYQYQGDALRALYGTLNASMADGPTVDASAVVSLDVADDRDSFATVSDADRDALKTAMWVDGEILAYKTAAHVGGTHYDLSSLRRGCLGTPTGAHASGAKAWSLDARVMSIPIPVTRYGTQVKVKLVAFNGSGRMLADAATAPVTTYTLPSSKTGATFIGTLPVRQTFDLFDRTEWEAVSTDPGILSSQLGGIDGGGVLRCAGAATLVHRALIPVDATKTYRVLARYRQHTNQTTGGRDIKVGLCGIAEDGITVVDLSAGTTLSSQHTLTANNASATGWVELNGYWKGRAGTGTVAGTLAAPGAFQTNVRYVRLMAQFNSASGDGIQELDQLELDVAVAEAGVEDGAITFSKLAADSIRTSNYAEDGSGNPTAGAKMDKSGTALKVAASNFQLGKRILTDFGWIYAQAKVSVQNPTGYVVSYSVNVASVARVAQGGTNLPAFALDVTLTSAPDGTFLPVLQLLHGGVASWTHRARLVVINTFSSYTVFRVGIWRDDTGAWLDPTLANAHGLDFNFMVVSSSPS